MTTIFQDVDLVVTEIAALFTANDSWELVYDYFPGVDAFVGRTPILIVQDNGTQTIMAGQDTNPVSYQLLVSSWVLAFSETDNTVTSEAATTKRRALNKTIRQVIRDIAAGSMTSADHIEFTNGYSQVDNLITEGMGYTLETFELNANLSHGSK